MRARVIAGIAALIAAAALGGGGVVDGRARTRRARNFSSSQGQCVNSRLSIGGTSYSVDWYLPNGTASGLMLLEHGFFRTCPNLRGTSKAIMEKGVMVLCVNADMTGGNPALGRALGDLLASRELAPPAGKALPERYVVGGHSAGGHFASVVGARLAELGYPSLEGAVLFDPVAAGGFTANLQAISPGIPARALGRSGPGVREPVQQQLRRAEGHPEHVRRRPAELVRLRLRLSVRAELPHRRRGRELRSCWPASRSAALRPP